MLRLIILLPPPSFLPVCSQAKVKFCPISLCQTENLHHRLESREEGTAGRGQPGSLGQPGISTEGVTDRRQADPQVQVQ